MRRVLCVWFPRWPVQRLQNERPELRSRELVLFAGPSQRPLVTACTARAERLGVSIGHPLAEARTLLRNAHFLPADDVADREALRHLAIDGQRFSPLVGLEDASFPESQFSDVTGCTHLWNDEHHFIEAVGDYWTARGYTIQLALAGSLGAAWALAHATRSVVVPAEGESLALADLSVRLLRLPVTVLERLEGLGLRTIRQVLALPRETLSSRFGMILPQRLDQALGRVPEVFVAERLNEPLTATREWDVPLEDRLALAGVCRQVLQSLLEKSRHHPGAGFQELEGQLQTETGTVRLPIRLVRPSRDEAHFAQLVDLQLERTKLSGGVVAIRWTVLQLGQLHETAHNWFAPDVESDASRHLVALVDRLGSRLGEDVVLRAQTLPEAEPEHAVQLVPWTRFRPGKSEEYCLAPEHSRCRPFRLLNETEPIGVVAVAPVGHPIRVTWRKEDYRVIRSWGPERIATSWWRAPDTERDYYRAELEDGTHLWIFRDLRGGRWFLHGFFD